MVKTANELIEANGKQLPTQPSNQATGNPYEALFTDEQKHLVDWFFFRLQNIYQSKYLAQFPNDKALAMAKREYAQNIIQFTQEQLHRKFERLKVIMGDDDDYEWPNISKILAIHHGLSPDGTNAEAYIESRTAKRLPNRTSRQKGEETLEHLKRLFS